MADPNLTQIIEAILFSSADPLSIDKLKEFSGADNAKMVQVALEELRSLCDRQDRPYSVQDLAGGVRLSTRPAYAPWIARMNEAKSGKLSPAALETLAIIAYKQPIGRAEIEAIRGVQAGPILQTLLERDLIRVSGKSDALGHPLLYGTTTAFLEVFGLKALTDLPDINEPFPRPATPQIPAADPAGPAPAPSESVPTEPAHG